MKTAPPADIIICLCILLSLCLSSSKVFAAGLENGDCIKCHTQEVTEIMERGRKHGTAVTCLDCHLEHPPLGRDVIPECSICHAAETKSHYALAECVVCHNPHSPLAIEFNKMETVKPVCSSCHDNEGSQLSDYPSMHNELDCTACHPSHGKWMSCLECHDAHTANMDYDACLKCHKPHMPTVVKYDIVPNDWCSGCHAEAFETLAVNQSKHHDLSCVYCHKYQHKLVPECETCHGLPHGQKMHKKYPDCRECHTGPHNLDM